MNRFANRSIVILAVILATIGGLVACDNPLLTAVQAAVNEARAGDAPQLLSISPAVDSSDVPTSTAVTLVFDVAIDAASISNDTVTLLKLPEETEITIVIAVSNESKTITLTPAIRLDRDTSYRVEVSTGLRSQAGASFATAGESNFHTRYFHNDDIGIDLSYSSDTFELGETAPIYMEAYPVPLAYPIDFGSIVVLEAYQVTSTGRFAIPQSALPGTSGQALLRFFHDLDNSYVGDGDAQDSNDSVFWFNSNEPGNLVDEASGTIIELDGESPVIVDDAYVIMPGYTASVGNGYAVSFSDSSTVSPDGFETGDGLGPASSRVLSLATYETARNLHALDDIDYFRFTPSTTDRYEVRIAESSFELQIALYSTDSNALTETSPLSTSSGTAARILNPGGTLLTGGWEYYLRVESPTGGLGSYDLGYFFTPVSADPHEDNDSIGTATPLAFGRANAQTNHTAEASDLDYFEIVTVEGQNYIIEIVEDPSPFGFGAVSRGLELDFRAYTSGGTPVGLGWEMAGNTYFIDDPATGGWAAGTYYLEVSNVTPQVGGELETPTGTYSISYTYGPDSGDELNNPFSGQNEYDLWNEHGPTGYQAAPYIPYGEVGRHRTIYSSEVGGNPEEDVDWIYFSVWDYWDPMLVVVEPESGADGVVVDFSIYRSKWVVDIVAGDHSEPDLGTAVVTSGQEWWSTDDRIRGASFAAYNVWFPVGDPTALTSEERTFWIRVERDATYGSNPITGGYVLKLFADADQEDGSYNPAPPPVSDVEVTIYSGSTTGSPPVYTGGIDETPWMGEVLSIPSSDFGDRNMLTWDTAGNANTEDVYNSLFRKDHPGSGEPDGVNDPSTDHEFYWFQMPPTTDVGKFYIIGYSRSQPAVPLKITVWNLSSTNRDTAATDRVITEADLAAYDDWTYTFYTSYLTDESSEKVVGLSVDFLTTEPIIDSADGTYGYSDGDYFFFKVERDNSRTTYVDQNGDTQTYAQHGAYDFHFWEAY